ncbi:MAG: glycine cleavage system protein GcvH [Desulfovibrionaceae bacterium]
MIPRDLFYTKSHEWARIEDEIATVGITEFAQEQLGDLTYVELPDVGDTFQAGAEVGSVESVKAASELYTPVSGEIVEVNGALDDDPGLVNREPYGDGWLVKIKLSEEPEDLMDAEEYASHLESEPYE